MQLKLSNAQFPCFPVVSLENIYNILTLSYLTSVCLFLWQDKSTQSLRRNFTLECSTRSRVHFMTFFELDGSQKLRLWKGVYSKSVNTILKYTDKWDYSYSFTGMKGNTLPQKRDNVVLFSIKPSFSDKDSSKLSRKLNCFTHWERHRLLV